MLSLSKLFIQLFSNNDSIINLIKIYIIEVARHLYITKRISYTNLIFLIMMCLYLYCCNIYIYKIVTI